MESSPRRNRFFLVLQLLLLIALSVALYQEKQKIKRLKNTTADVESSFNINYQDAYQRGPEKRDLMIPLEEDQVFLANQLKQIFPDATKLSDEQKAIAIMKYISSSFVLKSNTGSATKLLKDRYAICGGMSFTYIILARKAGIPARYVGSLYLPNMRSHAIAELYYDKRWHLFDPTFGIFFYSQSEYDQKGLIASFHDMVSNASAWTAIKVVEQPWQGKYDESVRNFPVIKAEEDFLKRKYGLAIPQLYLNNLKDSFPVAYGDNDLVSYPVDIDLMTEAEKWFGRRDNSNTEFTKYMRPFIGSGYLGGAAPVGYHTWLIRAPKYSRLKIEYYSTSPDTLKILQLTPLRSINLIDKSMQKDRVSFTVFVNDEQAIASIFCPNGTFQLDAIRVERVSN